MKDFIKAKTMNAVIEAWRSVEDDSHRIKDPKDLGECCWENAFDGNLSLEGKIFVKLVAIIGTYIMEVLSFLRYMEKQGEDYRTYIVGEKMYNGAERPTIIIYKEEKSYLTNNDAISYVKSAHNDIFELTCKVMRDICFNDQKYKELQDTLEQKMLQFIKDVGEGREEPAPVISYGPEEMEKMTCWEFCNPVIRECPSVIKTGDGFYEFFTNTSREDQRAFATASYISGLRVVFADKAFGLYGQPVDDSVGVYVEIPEGDRPWMFYSYLVSYLCRCNPEYSINKEKM